MNIISIYSSMPVFMQNILCSAHGFKLKKQRFNDDFFKILEFLHSTSNWSAEEITAYKEENIYKIIEHAYNHCPYYRRKYSESGISPKDFKSIKDIEKYPILTKEDVRANWKEMVANNVKKEDLIPFQTSGTTGKALSFYLTKYSTAYYWAVDQRYKDRFGFDFGKCCLNSTGRPVVPVTAHKPPYWRYDRVLKRYFLNAQQISSDKIDLILDFLDKKSFDYFIGYPSIMTALANEIDASGRCIKNPPKHIFTGAEKIYTSQKEILHDVFSGVAIHELYSFSEQAAIATHCLHNVYHEDFEFGHIELNNTEIIEGGIQGDILATGLVNFGMPFIRYQNGDSAVFADQECTCGLKSRVISDIVGRIEDYVITPEGVKIQRFASIFKNTSGIKESQVIQRELNEMIIRIVPRESYTQKTEKQLLVNVKQWISPTIQVKFEYVSEIERTKAGKFRAVVSEINK